MNQPKAHILKQRAELVYPYLALPEGVREFRPFYEGVLSFHHTKGDRLKVYHGYRKDGFHAQDWNLGWQTAKQYEEWKQTFKFLTRVEIEGSQIEAPDLTSRSYAFG